MRALFLRYLGVTHLCTSKVSWTQLSPMSSQSDEYDERHVRLDVIMPLAPDLSSIVNDLRSRLRVSEF